MNNIEFVEKLKKIEQSPTHYAKGTFGQTKNIIPQKARQYPSWYTQSKVDELMKCDDATKFYDCCGLVKSILWTNKSGQIVYTSNGVPDIDETTMFNRCKEKSTNFDIITPGELVWTTGHVGVYIGDGLVIECTNAFTKDVCITSFIKGRAKNYRQWKKHGKLPWIEYKPMDSFLVVTNHDLVECFDCYKPIKKLSNMVELEIVETIDNFGKTKEGYWVDLTKCRRITRW